MIHLVRDYFLNIDKQSGGCYTVGKAQSCVSERVLLSRPRYLPYLSRCRGFYGRNRAPRRDSRRRGSDLAGSRGRAAPHPGRDHNRCGR